MFGPGDPSVTTSAPGKGPSTPDTSPPETTDTAATEPVTTSPTTTSVPGKEDWQRTVIYMHGTSQPGQDLFYRGGIDGSKRPGKEWDHTVCVNSK